MRCLVKNRLCLNCILKIGFGFLTLGFIVLIIILQLAPPPNPERSKPEGLLNLLKFQYILTPHNFCDPKNSKTIHNFVHSSRENLASRNIIRKTYGSIITFQGWQIRVVFLLGEGYENEDPKKQQDLVAEAQTHGDILMGQFIDTYRNLSYKHLMGYKWTTEFCSSESFYLKSDDDTLVDIFHVIKFLENQKSKNFYYCHILSSAKPFRDNSNKKFARWAVSLAEYPKERYPSYCGFSVYLTSVETVQKIYFVSKKVEFFWIDDVFTTGILRENAMMKLNYSTNFIFSNVFDYGVDKKDIFKELRSLRKNWLAIIVESRDAEITCQLWRRIEDVHFKALNTSRRYGECESL